MLDRLSFLFFHNIMKKIYTFILLLIISPTFANQKIDKLEQKKIIKTIIKKEIKNKKKYNSVTALRKTKLKIYNYKENKLLDTIESKVLLTRHFNNTKIKIKVLLYKKNGEILSPDKYKKSEKGNIIDVFSKKGLKEYRLVFGGFKTIGKIRTYIIKVIPLKKTKHHFSGKMFYDIQNLSLVAIEGRPVKSSFPVEKIYIYMEFKSLGGISVIKNSYVVLYINVPIFFSHRKMVIRSSLSDHVLK